MAKKFLRVDAIQSSPATGGASQYSWFEAPAGYRILGVFWQSLLPAGAGVADVHGNMRVTIGSPIIEVDVMDYDRFRAVMGPNSGILNNFPGQIADIPLSFSEFERSSPALAEASALDLPTSGQGLGFDLPKCIIELQYKARTAAQGAPSLGAVIYVESLDEIPRSEWNVVWSKYDNSGRPTNDAVVVNLKVPKVRSAPMGTNGAATFVNENFQSFAKDKLDAILYTIPDGANNLAVLNQVVIEVSGKNDYRWTKLESDNLLRRCGLNPGADFLVLPTASDRDSDLWDLRGKTVKQFLYFTDALGGPDAAGVNKLAPVGSVRVITFHRGLLIG